MNTDPSDYLEGLAPTVFWDPKKGYSRPTRDYTEYAKDVGKYKKDDSLRIRKKAVFKSPPKKTAKQARISRTPPSISAFKKITGDTDPFHEVVMSVTKEDDKKPAAVPSGFVKRAISEKDSGIKILKEAKKRATVKKEYVDPGDELMKELEAEGMKGLINLKTGSLTSKMPRPSKKKTASKTKTTTKRRSKLTPSKKKSVFKNKEERDAFLNLINPFMGNDARHFDQGTPESLPSKNRQISEITIPATKTAVLFLTPGCNAYFFAVYDRSTGGDGTAPNLTHIDGGLKYFPTVAAPLGTDQEATLKRSDDSNREQWRFCSGGMKIKNLSATISDAGYFEAWRLNDPMTDDDLMLMVNDDLNGYNLVPHGTFLKNLMEGDTRDNVYKSDSYINGELRHVHKHTFTIHPTFNEHNFIPLKEHYSMKVGALQLGNPARYKAPTDRMTGWNYFTDSMFDRSYGSLVVAIHAGASDQSILVDVCMNYEIIHTVASGLHEFHKASLQNKFLDTQYQKAVAQLKIAAV